MYTCGSYTGLFFMSRKQRKHSASTPRASSGLDLLHTLSGRLPGWIASVAFSPDGSKLSVAAQLGGIQVWSVKDAKPVFEVHIPHYHTYSANWHPGGDLIATCHDDPTVRVWDARSGKLVRELLALGAEEIREADMRADARRRRVRSAQVGEQSKKGKSRARSWTSTDWPFKTSNVGVRSVVWSPNGKFLATADDFGVRVWDGNSYSLIRIFREVSRPITIRWSPDGRRLAATSYEGGVCIFDVEAAALVTRIESSFSSALAWSPDGTRVASGSDKAVCIWDSSKGRLLNALEAHVNPVRAACFSPDGQLLASRALNRPNKPGQVDDRIILWRTDSWEICGTIRERPDWYLYTGLAFSPDGTLLATCGEHDKVVRLWSVDIAKLLAAAPKTRSVYYKNAKVALLGDTGVGKSGLELVLSGRPYAPTDSTHARRVRILHSERVTLSRGKQEIREIILWDLAGQPGYRLIHQLHLDDVSVGLIVFDSRGELDPFTAVRYWNKALLQATVNGPVPSRILVAARVDRGPLGVSKQRIEAIGRELGSNSYVETSAKEGIGINELRAQIEACIQWPSLPTVTSNVLFQRMRAFLTRERKSGRVLISVDELIRGFLRSQTNRYRNTESLREEFHTCVSRLQTLGLLRRFSFGNLVLLQPEILDAYSSCIIFAAKQEPDGMGSIREDDVRAGRFPMSASERLSDASYEKLLLVATVEDLIAHEIALREPAADAQLLIFPSQLTRENPELPDPPGKETYFKFEGPSLKMYATLVVRLSHGGVFTIRDMWKNAVTFTARVGGTCGIYLTETDEGHGTITLFYSEETTTEIKRQFEDYVHTHLLRRALPNTVERGTVINCSACATVFTEQAIKKRTELGFDWIACSVCDTKTTLQPGGPSVPITPQVTTRDIDRSAARKRVVDAALIAASGEMQTVGFRDWAGADRTTLALMFTDIIGSTAMGEDLGDEGMATVRHAHFEHVRILIHRHKAYEIKTVGDSFMLAFRTAVQALNFALELQRNTGDLRVQIRAGIHVGPVHVEEEDAFGRMVNYTARVVSEAKGPEIWVSERAYSDITGERSKSHANLDWVEHPGCELKGFKGKQVLWSTKGTKNPSKTE